MSRMPGDSNWNTPLVRALLKISSIGFRVVERKVFDAQLHAAMAFDQLQRVVDDGQRGQPQKIHLEQVQLFEADHVVLR